MASGIKTLSELGILRQQDPEACTVTVSPTITDRRWRRRKRCDRPRKRGARAGIRARLHANPHRAARPSVLLSNVHSLENKVDYLRLDLSTQRKAANVTQHILLEEYAESVMCDVWKM
ncbi:hypothetical protein P4O66_019002 [Electrophorus voltai]|uniref:Uncharacterized protein n=1 Tax=Electrophorus voltai TaxID=2609070 RepID=A0AAD8YR16_9TELE|nr:hypothetical protein P4O66_019002 [Electrophorus voltai]